MTVIGTGFVGVVTSAVYAHIGQVVVGIDVDEQKIQSLSEGIAPFFEPHLNDLIREGIAGGRLAFTTRYEEAVPKSDVIILAVGTPSAKNGTADLTYIYEAARTLGKFLKPKTVIAIKSTVPPGTNEKVAEVIRKETEVPFYVAAVPEFLREGSAVADMLEPDRIVIGSNEKLVVKRLLDLNQKLPGERVIVSAESAQMAKYTANAYLAQRITFINQIANLCEKNGAKISEVIEAIGHDKRIGKHYWYPGLGYGGSCFPKDVKELAAYAKSMGEGSGLLPKIDELNDERIPNKLKEYERIVGGFADKKVAVLGLSFKPNTNDTRFAPSLKIVPYLLKNQALVMAYDPQVEDKVLQIFPGVAWVDDPYRACSEAAIIMLLIEWSNLTQLNLQKMADVAKPGAYFIDTRNQYPREAAEAAGLKYIGIGNG